MSTFWRVLYYLPSLPLMIGLGLAGLWLGYICGYIKWLWVEFAVEGFRRGYKDGSTDSAFEQ